MSDMKAIVFGSTKAGYEIPLEEALNFSSHAAGVCYMKDDLEKIMNEDIEKTKGRIERTLGGGHHSVYQHIHYTLVFTGIPKIIAMILNNERPYTTSEKSGRYTDFKDVSPDVRAKYDKWKEIFYNLITEKRPILQESHKKKLAMENARYLTSVFTPTTMVYTTNLGQLNYLHEMLTNFVDEVKTDISTAKGFVLNAPFENHDPMNERKLLFFGRLHEEVQTFIELLKPFYIEGLQRPTKDVKVSLFHRPDKDVYPTDYFNDIYSTYYYGTFAQFGQTQRHRTINHKIELINYIDESGIYRIPYYVPEIISDNPELVKDWLNDLNTMAKSEFPQALKVRIYENGQYSSFKLKTYERLCCHAQHEIMEQTKETLLTYIDNAPANHPIHADYSHVTRETFKNKQQLKNLRCAGRCNFFGRKFAIDREV